jgi:ribose/xylose/arabinose/galactoside ABC-type transport system permease subunit
MGLVAARFYVPAAHPPMRLSLFGWSYLTAGFTVTALLATASAWIHQWALRRLTFAWFRLYAALVTAGIGGVFGLCIAFMATSGHVWPFIRGLSLLIFIVVFGVVAYRNAPGLRGTAPESFSAQPAE